MTMTSRIASQSHTKRALIGARFCFACSKKNRVVFVVWQIPHLYCQRTLHNPHTSNELEMVSSSWMEDLAMTRSIIDTKFPYVLVCSTFGAIVSLASVWLVTSLTYAPTLVA